MKCKSCGLEKDPSLFYKSDQKTCKECVKARVRNNREEKADYYREFDKKRANNLERVQARKDYLSTEAGKKSKQKAVQKYKEKNPKKRAAHVITGNAIRDWKLVKGLCEVCGTDENIVAHHSDYDRPLDVTWLCAMHHTEWHKENGEGENAH